MIDKENVIANSIEQLDWYFNEDDGCASEKVTKIAYRNLKEIVLALLKEQVPHVMTAEEALTRRIGYLETRINGHAYRGGYVLVQTLEIMMGDSWKWELVRTINSAVYFYQDQYNRDFRLWSERPNDKKRKAVKWND